MLVVIAILLLLISLLVPGLQRAREQARGVQCAGVLHGLSSLLHLYTTEYDGWMPGVNTTGFAVRVRMKEPGGLNDPGTPVQDFDWMTPLARYEMALPARRADRWHAAWTRYACPSMRAMGDPVSPWLSGKKPDDLADFYEHEWSPCSYLMPAYFSYWGHKHGNPKLTIGGPNRVTPIFWDAYHPDYVSRIERIGTASEKVFAADGTRYVPHRGDTDFDAFPVPDYYGAFTGSGAWFGASTAYGVQNGSLTWDGREMVYMTGDRNWAYDGRMVPWTYRHGARSRAARTARENTGAINAVFFDGHVQSLGDRASREIKLWYPKGTIVRYNGHGMTYVELGTRVP